MAQVISDWGWDDRWAEVFRETGMSELEPGRVTSHHRDRWMVRTADGLVRARLVGSSPIRPMPETGDWVVGEPGPETSDPWTIRGVLPRRSAVSRASAGDGRAEQILAANIDRLWIVQGLDTAPNLRSLERYLSVAWESGAVPEIVLTKSDLAGELEESAEAVRGVAFGVPVWVVSQSDAEALDAMRRSLERGQTVALLGPSGAGKSTLINSMAQADVAPTGEVRGGDGKGRHTTTSRELVQIHNGALLLDTPGLRELRVLTLDEGLGRAFPEIDELAEDCRFRDCTHATEPGCAVLRAVELGELAAERLASFRKLEAEAAYERRRTDPRAMAEAVAEHKTAMRTVKYHPKYQQRD